MAIARLLDDATIQRQEGMCIANRGRRHSATNRFAELELPVKLCEYPMTTVAPDYAAEQDYDCDRRQPAASATRRAAGHWAVALFDQAVVSGTRFLASILIARYCGPTELGHYSVAFMAFLLAGCIQESLVTTPYAVHCHGMSKRRRGSYGGATFVMHLALAGISAVVFLLVGAFWPHASDAALFRQIALAVAITLPFSLAWEFARRSTLAHLDVTTVAIWDSIASILQIGALCALIATGYLSAITGLFAIAAGCSVVGILWLRRCGDTLKFHPRLLGNYVRLNWRLGSWLLIAQLAGSLHGMIPSLLLAVLAGPTPTGIYAAYLNFTLLANPLLLAVANLLTPKVSKSLHAGTLQKSGTLVRNVVMALAAALTCYVITLAVCGDQIVWLMYGSPFVGHHEALLVLGGCTILWAASMTFAAALVGLDSPRSSFLGTLGGMLVTAGAGFTFVQFKPVLGAAAGLFCGSAVAAALHLILFVRRYQSLLAERSPKPIHMAELNTTFA